MLVFLFILLLIIFMGMQVTPQNKFNDDYMSIQKTTAINGIFVLLVFLSHARQYIDISTGALDAPYLTMKTYLGQMVVVTFLFYSGYGMMESIKKKRMNYIKSIPFKRFFKVLYHMSIAVLCFVMVQAVFSKFYDFKTILLSFIGWKSVGNSNWYIFAVLVLYIITFVSFIIARDKKVLGVCLVTILSMGFVYWQMKMNRPDCCYNTVILFPAGMIFSLVKDKVEKIITKNDTIYMLFLAAVFALYLFFYNNISEGIEQYSMWGILFMALIVLVSMKVSIDNNILQWFGSHVFSVYILQRIPMIILTYIGYSTRHKYAFITVSFVATIVMAQVFDVFVGKLDNFIYKPRKKLSDKKSIESAQ